MFPSVDVLGGENRPVNLIESFFSSSPPQWEGYQVPLFCAVSGGKYRY